MSSSRRAISFLAVLVLATPVFADGRCSSDHYPVASGDVNEYRLTSRQLAADGSVLATTSTLYREEVTAVDDDVFRVTTTTDGNTSQAEWLCTDDGLAMKLADYPGMNVTTTGVSIPAKMDVGFEWTQTFESSGEGISQRMNTDNRVTGREQVTVPAGTWEAFRIDYEIETVVPDQPTSVINGTQWFALGVGLVKSTSVIPMEGEISSIETTIELTKRTTR